MPQYLNYISVADLDGTNGFAIENAADGWAVAMGDVNGDGFSDLIVGAVSANSSAGAARVVLGKATGWTGLIGAADLASFGYSLDAADPNGQAGSSVASAGDVNGDGRDDIIVGAPWSASNGVSQAGKTYVVFGADNGADVSLAGLDGENGFCIEGLEEDDLVGWSVAMAGDVNDDGIGDLIVSAHNAGAGGQAYVLFGKASGWSAVFDPTDLDGTNGFRLDGEEGQFGWSVASAGDVNGDGVGDMIVGAHDLGILQGRSYVVFGKSAWDASVDVSALNGSDGFSIDGVDTFDQSGQSVASAGDINGDGYGDLIIGAHGGDPGDQANAGESYVVFGKAAGWDASIAPGALNGTNGFRLNGVAPSNASGYAVASAGDFNGDGVDDLIVGAPSADPSGGFHAGMSYLVFGKAAGWAADFELSSLDGDTGIRIDGAGAFSNSGSSFAFGDVNGDGFSDIIIGATGTGYVIFGHPPGQAVTRIGTAMGQTIHGGEFNDVLKGMDGADVLLGAGGGDQMIGGLGDDTITGGEGADTIQTGRGSDSLDGGDGVDTLWHRYSTAVYVSLFDDTVGSGFGTDSIAGFENVKTGAGDDTIVGSGGDNKLQGRGGDDSISAQDGSDQVFGGVGDDTLLGGLGADLVSGGGGNDQVSGGADADTLLGGNGDDTLYGGGDTGNILTGGHGEDLLSGSNGGSTFVFSRLRDTNGSGDTINGINATDIIDVSGIDANGLIDGDQDFTIVDAFTRSRGELMLRYDADNNVTYVLMDVNGDGLADGTVTLGGGDHTDFSGFAGADFAI